MFSIFLPCREWFSRTYNADRCTTGTRTWGIELQNTMRCVVVWMTAVGWLLSQWKFHRSRIWGILLQQVVHSQSQFQTSLVRINGRRLWTQTRILRWWQCHFVLVLFWKFSLKYALDSMTNQKLGYSQCRTTRRFLRCDQIWINGLFSKYNSWRYDCFLLVWNPVEMYRQKTNNKPHY